MEDKILDYIEEFKPRGSILSVISFVFAVFNLLFFLYLISRASSRIAVDQKIIMPQLWIIQAFLISCLIGLIISFGALIRKEKRTFWKIIGCSLNFLLFAIIIWLIIYANTR